MPHDNPPSECNNLQGIGGGMKIEKALIKSLTYRIGASIITASLTFIVTGSLHFAGSVAVGDMLLKFTWYYLHEKIWESSCQKRINET